MTTFYQAPKFKLNGVAVATGFFNAYAGRKIATAVYKYEVHKGAILQS